MSKSGNVKLGRDLHAKLKKAADAEKLSIVGMIRYLLAYYRKDHEKSNR
jgi:hypothetical protein